MTLKSQDNLQQIYVEYHLTRREDQHYLIAISSLLSLDQGAVTLAPDDWEIVRLLSSDPALETKVRSDERLPKGSYQVCVRIHVLGKNLLASDSCFQLNVSNSKVEMPPINSALNSLVDVKNPLPQAPGLDIPTSLPNAGKTPLIGFHGQAGVTAGIRNRNFYNQQIPANFVRWEVNPELTIAGVPISTGFYVTTEQQQVNYNLNRFSLRLNTQAFKQQMTKRLRKKMLSELAQRDSIRESYQHYTKQKVLVDQELSNYDGRYDFSDFDSYCKKYEQDSTHTLKERIEHRKLLKAKHEYDSLTQIQETLQAQDKYFNKMGKMGILDSTAGYSRPETRAEKLNRMSQHPEVSGFQRFLLSIETFEVGNIFPYYSPLFMGGVTLNGLNMEVQQGQWYYAIIGGTAWQWRSFAQTNADRAGQWLLGARFGKGRKEGNHLYASVLNGAQRDPVATSDSLSFLPVIDRNVVLHLESRILITPHIFFDAEYGAALTRTLEASNNDVPLLRRASLGGSLDQANRAWKLGINGNVPTINNNFSLQLQRTGAAYYTVGNPWLRSDLLRYKVKSRQKIFKKRFTLSASAQHDQDNLSGHKRYQTLVRSYTLGTEFYLKKWPSVKLLYSPFYQETQPLAPEASIRNQSQVATAVATYVKPTKRHYFTTVITHTWQKFVSDRLPAQITRYVTFGQYALLNRAWNLGTNLTYAWTANQDSSQIFSGDLTVQQTNNKQWKQGGGLYYTEDLRWGTSTGISYQLTGVILKRMVIKVDARQNFFQEHNPLYNRGDQSSVITSLIYQW